MRLKLKFEPRDLWVGIYWKTFWVRESLTIHRKLFRLYICVVPLFPISVTFRIKTSDYANPTSPTNNKL